MDKTIRDFSKISEDAAQKEVDKLMPLIRGAKNLNKMPDDIDKTPASVSKFTSKKSSTAFNYQVNNNAINNENKDELKNEFSRVIHRNLVEEQKVNDDIR